MILFLGRVLYLSALPVPPYKVAQLKVGMTKSEVRDILGEPEESGKHGWTYDTFFGIGWVTIYFDDDEKISWTDNEPTEFYCNFP